MLVLQLLFFLIGLIDSYKVLVYNPVMYHSHVKFMNSIADTLAEAGHDVTVLMPIVNVNYANKSKLVFVKKIIQHYDEEKAIDGFQMMFGSGNNSESFNTWKLSIDFSSIVKIFKAAMKLPQHTCKKLVADDQLLAKLKAENFDLGISEAMGICAFAIFDYLEIPSTIACTSFSQALTVADAIGEPASASHIPSLLYTSGEDMNIFQRAQNLLLLLTLKYGATYIYGTEFQAFENLQDYKVKSWREYLGSVSFNFVNSHPFLDFPHPTLPKTIDIGGISVGNLKRQNSTLAAEWNEVLDRRSTNILISFGTFARTADMPEEYKKTLIKVFETYSNITFIFKYEEPEDAMFENIPNLVLTPWMPQVQLLADPRLNLFITHGGLGSVIELAFSGMPAIVIPVQGDQSRNAEMLVRHKTAIRLTKYDLEDSEHLINAVKEMLGNERYRKNAKRLTDLLNSQPIAAKDAVVRYSELAAKFGKLAELDSYAKDMSAFKFYMYDVALLILFTITLIFVLLFFCCRFTYRKISRRCRRNKVEQNNDQTEALITEKDKDS